MPSRDRPRASADESTIQDTSLAPAFATISDRSEPPGFLGYDEFWEGPTPCGVTAPVSFQVDAHDPVAGERDSTALAVLTIGGRTCLWRA